MYYTLSIVRKASVYFKFSLYRSLILRTFRVWFFSIGLLLMSIVFFFTILIHFLRALLLPIKTYIVTIERLIKNKRTDDLDSNMLIDNHNEITNTESSNKSNEDNENYNRISQNIDFNNKNIHHLNTMIYKNKETKIIEDTLVFLNKLLMLKNKEKENYINYEERANIYKKFLMFLDEEADKNLYKQCYLVIAYSKFKKLDYEEAYSDYKKILEKIDKEERFMVKSNDSIDHKLLNMMTNIKENSVFYLNEFTNLEMFNKSDNDTITYVRLKLMKQQVLYFCGLIKYQEYNEYSLSDIDYMSNCNSNELLNEDSLKTYIKRKECLKSGIESLKQCLDINNNLNMNYIKSIFIVIILSEMSIELEEYSEANTYIKDALLKFSELNKYFFDKKLENLIDPKIVLLINSIILEKMLLIISKLAYKYNKFQLSAFILNKLLDICMFIDINTKKEVLDTIYSMLFENNNNIVCDGINNNKNNDSKYINKNTTKSYKNSPLKSLNKANEVIIQSYFKNKLLLEKLSNINNNIIKHVLLAVSDNFLRKYKDAGLELREVLLNCISLYLSNSDIISYCQYGEKSRLIFPPYRKLLGYKYYKESESFCILGWGFNEVKQNLYNCIIESLLILDNEKLLNSNSHLTNTIEIENNNNFSNDNIDNLSNFDNNKYTCKNKDNKENYFNNIENLLKDTYIDKYLFFFTLIEDFNFNSEDETRDIIKKALELNLSFFVFIIGNIDEETESRANKISKFLKNFVQGYVVLVKNFNIIEEVFQSISIKVCKENFESLVNANFENYKLIS